MKGSNLTEPAGNATNFLQKKSGASAVQGRAKSNWKAVVLCGAGALSLSGCINLTAPTDPIVITLNINIEVIARLADDASEAIDENADIF